MNKISTFIDKYYKILILFVFFVLLFYPFNISIRNLVIPNDYLLSFIYLVTTFLAFLLNYNDIKENFKKNYKLGITLLIVLSIILIRNGDLSNGHLGVPFFLTIGLVNMYIFSHSKKWINAFFYVALIYSIEHIFFTLLFAIIPNWYANNIIPLFPEFTNELLWQFDHKQMAGLTFHYSTNAGYLTFGLFLILSQLIKTKKNTRSWYIYLILLIANVIAILMTGKRTHLFFSLFVIVTLLLLINRKLILNNKGKFCIISFLIIVIGFISFKYIDLLSAPVERLIDGIKNGNLFYTRKPMYKLAIELFKKNELIGNGWGTYKYFYNDIIIEKERELMDTHNIYLQMLCEIGILGSLFIISLFVFLYVRVFKSIFEKGENKNTTYMLFMLQTFILLEGIVGNPIYDIQEVMPYMFVVSAFLACDIKEKKEEELVNERKNFEC